MKSVLLKSRTTGEKKAFPNIVQAAKFIGHNDSYIHNMHKQGKCLNSKFTGEQYDVFVGLDEIAIEDYIPDEYTGKSGAKASSPYPAGRQFRQSQTQARDRSR